MEKIFDEKLKYNPSKIQKILTELISSFLYVFVSCFAFEIFSTTSQPIILNGIAIFLTRSAIICMFYKLTGAITKPIYDLSFYFLSDLGYIDLIYNLISQFIGGILASLVLLSFFGETSSLGRPIITISIYRAFSIEIFGTIILVFINLMLLKRTSLYKSKFIVQNALISGGMEGIIVMLCIPFSGGSLDWYRYLCPSIISNDYNNYDWIYIVGPLIGCIFSALLYWLIYEYAIPQPSKWKTSVIVY